MATAKKERSFKSIVPKQIKWEAVGQVYEGAYMGGRWMDINGDPAFRCTLEQPEEDTPSWFFAGTALANLLEGVEVGSYVRITRVDDGPVKKGNALHLYNGEVAED